MKNNFVLIVQEKTLAKVTEANCNNFISTIVMILGDSGGPLQLSFMNYNYYIAGVVSFGQSCGSKVPGVYTKVSSHIDWIEEVVWKKTT